MITYSLKFTLTNLIGCIDSYFLSRANITSEMVPKWLHLELRLLAAGLVSAWVRPTRRETRPRPRIGGGEARDREPRPGHTWATQFGEYFMMVDCVMEVFICSYTSHQSAE